MSLFWFTTNTHAHCNGTSANTTIIKNLLAQTVIRICHGHPILQRMQECSRA